MAKYCGKIGFETSNSEPDEYGDCGVGIEERLYYGDITKVRYNNQNSSFETTITDTNISNSFSILADPFCLANFHLMRYIVWNDVKWKINSIEVQYPRVILTVGGVYNGPQN